MRIPMRASITPTTEARVHEIGGARKRSVTSVESIEHILEYIMPTSRQKRFLVTPCLIRRPCNPRIVRSGSKRKMRNIKPI
jgi:hypothetical protein